MKFFLLLACVLSPLVAAAQLEGDRVLLVEHHNFKKQFFFTAGNTITFLTREGEKAHGIVTEITDSTLRVENKVYRLADIAKIKRRTSSVFKKVIGGIFILDGILVLGALAADPGAAGEGTALLGIIFLAVGVPLVIEPSFKVGVNCRLRVAINAGYINRR